MASIIPRTLNDVRSWKCTYLSVGSMVPSTVTTSMPAQYKGQPCFGTAIDVAWSALFVALNRPFANHLSTERPDGGRAGRRCGVSGASTLTITGSPVRLNRLTREAVALGRANRSAGADSSIVLVRG